MILREITVDDSKFLYELYINRDEKDQITKIEFEGQKKFVDNYINKSFEHPFESWLIIEIDGKQAGSLTLNKKNNELGYWLDKKFQGKGIGSKAVKQFMDLHNKSMYTIRSHIENKKSQKIAEKIGFKLTRYEYTFKK
jgi:RimJ/RimL family protein N-acetyltransferase